jgi:hypothetical protein
VPAKFVLHVVSSVVAAGAYGIPSCKLGAAALCGSTSVSPSRSRPLYLRCSVLLI